MTLHLDHVDEDTRYLCEYIDGEYQLITACTGDASGIIMLGIMQSAYPSSSFELLTDRPSQRLDEYDFDRFLEYRHELIRPVPNAKRPRFILIDGGKS